jgi:hypothetical protein
VFFNEKMVIKARSMQKVLEYGNLRTGCSA